MSTTRTELEKDVGHLLDMKILELLPLDWVGLDIETKAKYLTLDKLRERAYHDKIKSDQYQLRDELQRRT